MKLIYLLSFSLCLATTSVHEFHVSKCLIKYKQETSALQISLHIFLDDLEAALSAKGATNLYLCSDKEVEGAEDHIIGYLSKQFQIKQNGTLLKTNFIGKEISDDLAAVWCYIEITDVAPEGEIEIKNEILLDLFDDQKNITSVKLPSQNEYYLFQKGETSEKLNF